MRALTATSVVAVVSAMVWRFSDDRATRTANAPATARTLTAVGR